jgi:hypothetical protein
MKPAPIASAATELGRVGYCCGGLFGTYRPADVTAFPDAICQPVEEARALTSV